MDKKSDDELLLQQLMAATPAAAPVAPASEPAAPRPRTTTKRTKPAVPAGDTSYDRWARLGGLLLGMGFVIGLWAVGAYFTLAFLESVGLKIAGARPIAFVIPAAITWLEIGLWPARTPNRISQTIWLIVLLVDAATTAAGIMQLAGSQVDVLGQVIAGWPLVGAAFVIGVILALFPERAGRSLLVDIRANWAEIRTSWEGGR